MNLFGKQPKSDVEDRIDGLEFKVNILLAMVAVQVCISLFLFAETLIPSWPTLILLMVFVGAFGWFFRGRIPSWLGALSRKAFESSDSKSNDKFK